MISKLLTPLSSSQLQVNHKVMSMNFDRYHLVWGLLDSRKRKPGSGAMAGEVTRCDPEQTFRVSTEFRMSLALGQKKKTKKPGLPYSCANRLPAVGLPTRTWGLAGDQADHVKPH